MRNVDMYTVSSEPNLPPPPSRIPLSFLAPTVHPFRSSFRCDRGRAVGNRRQMVFRAVAARVRSQAAARIIGDVTRGTDVARVFLPRGRGGEEGRGSGQARWLKGSAGDGA